MSEIVITLDDRIRLTSAVLAASKWPQKEQARETHAVHPLSKFTSQYVANHADHKAVKMTNELLDAGITLKDLFTVAVRSKWATFDPIGKYPDHFTADKWAQAVADFYVETAIAAFFWADHDKPWQEAGRDLEKIFQDSPLPKMLGLLTQKSINKTFYVIPSLTYPMLDCVVVTHKNDIYVVLTPPKAWGESPPWPYHEGVEWSLSHVCYQLVQHLLAEELVSLSQDQQEMIKHATIVLLLEKTLSEPDAMAYMVRSKKQYKLPKLPLAVEQLRDYLNDPTEKRLLAIGRF